MDSKYFKVFNPASDILGNPAKKYEQYFFPAGKTLTLGTSSLNAYVVTGSNNGVQILNITSGSSTSVIYKSLQSMLRYDKANIGLTDWVPITSSDFNMAAKYATFISFNRNLYGDRLCLSSTDQNDTFRFAMGGKSYTLSTAYNEANVSYNIVSSYTSIDTNFAVVKNSAGDYAGLAFGDLGLIMLYTSSAMITPQNIIAPSFLYEQTFNSKAYFCRVTHDAFNATINRTWYTYSADLSAYVTKPGIDFTAITTIGLYNDQDELLAIAKLSQPIPKYIDSELNAKVVLEY